MSTGVRPPAPEFDLEIRTLVYEHFATTGSAPAIGTIAQRAAALVDDVRAAYQRLRQSRVLLAEADGATIRMAPPFSGVPTQHRVLAGDINYFANCAWDALGVVAALKKDGVVHSMCGQSSQPLRLHVTATGPEPSDWVFHCLVPASRWWDDLVFT